MLLIIPFIFISCCNCGSENETYLNGKIVVVGNEPFAKLAIQIDNEFIIIKGEPKLLQLLTKKQGLYYTLEYNNLFFEDGFKSINVTKAIPLLNFSTSEENKK